MVNFEGKYELQKSENFAKYLLSLGSEVKEDFANKIESAKSTITITADGKKFIVVSEYGTMSKTTVFDTEDVFTEELITGFKVESVAVIEKNILLVRSSTPDFRSGDRIYDFSDGGLTITFRSSESDLVSTRTYKRL